MVEHDGGRLDRDQPEPLDRGAHLAAGRGAGARDEHRRVGVAGDDPRVADRDHRRGVDDDRLVLPLERRERRRELLRQQLAGVGRAAPAGRARRAVARRADRVASAATSPSRTSISPGVRGTLEQLGDPAAAQVAVDEDRLARPRARASRRAPNATVVLPWLPSGLVTTIERMLSSVKSRFVRRSRSASATTRKRGFVARSSGECSFRIADLGRDLGEDRDAAGARQVVRRLDLRGQVLAEQRRAEAEAEPEQRRRRAASASCAGRPVWSAEPAGRARAASATGSRPRSGSTRLSSARVAAAALSCASRGFVLRALIFMIPVPLNVSHRDRGRASGRAAAPRALERRARARRRPRRTASPVSSTPKQHEVVDGARLRRQRERRGRLVLGRDELASRRRQAPSRRVRRARSAAFAARRPARDR